MTGDMGKKEEMTGGRGNRSKLQETDERGGNDTRQGK